MAFLEDTHLSLKSKGIYNPRGPFAKSLLHYAAMGDCTELLLYLLQWKQGAAKEDRDQNKRTPLSRAAEYGALRVIEILLENGAKVSSMDDMLLGMNRKIMEKCNDMREEGRSKLGLDEQVLENLGSHDPQHIPILRYHHPRGRCSELPGQLPLAPHRPSTLQQEDQGNHGVWPCQPSPR